jgi:hypothetical protein
LALRQRLGGRYMVYYWPHDREVIEDKSLIEVSETKEYLDVLIALRLWLFCNSSHSVWVHDDALRRDDES